MPEPGENPRIDELKAQWEADPGGRVYLQLAEEYRKAGDIAQAIEVLEKSLTHRPRDPRGRVALARCHLDLGQPAEAAELLEGVTRQDPAHTLANKLLLESYLQLEDGDKAAERLNIYRLLNDRDPELDHLEYRLSRLTGPSEAERETLTDPGGEDLAEIMVSDLRESSEPSSPPSDTAPQPPEPPVMEADSSAQPETPSGAGASEPVEAMFELAPDPEAPMEPAPETPVESAPETPVALSPEAETLSADEGAARGTSTPDVFDLPTAAPPERSPEDVFDLGAVGAAAADPVSAPAPVTDVFDLAPLPATVDLDALWGSASVPAAAAESVDSAPDSTEPVETVEAEAAQPDPPPTWTEAPSDAGVEIQPVEFSSQESQVPETTAEDLQAAESVAVEVETPSTPEDSGVAPESPAVELANEGLETSSTETATLGLLYLKQGHHDEAERIFRRILERDPEHGSALDGLRQLEELRGETADPATSIEPTAASEPEPTQAREAEPELEPEPVLESAPEFEPVPESASEPETVLETAPEPEAVLEVAPELGAFPEIAPELEPAPVQELEPEPVQELEPEPALELEPEPALEELEPEPALELEPESTLDSASAPEHEPNLEPAPVVGFEVDPGSLSTPASDLEVLPEPSFAAAVEAEEAIPGVGDVESAVDGPADLPTEPVDLTVTGPPPETLPSEVGVPVGLDSDLDSAHLDSEPAVVSAAGPVTAEALLSDPALGSLPEAPGARKALVLKQYLKLLRKTSGAHVQ